MEDKFSKTVKTYLSEDRFRIELDDLVNLELKKILKEIDGKDFPLKTESVDADGVSERLRKYELLLENLATIVILLCRWGSEKNLESLRNIFSRLPEAIEGGNGQQGWVALRWYSIIYLMYLAGISALRGNNYSALKTIFDNKIVINFRSKSEDYFLNVIFDDLSNLNSMIKNLPDHKNNYTPLSEYLFKTLKPILDDKLWLGKGYESLFDRFEIIVSLVFADNNFEGKDNERIWAPPGRFSWKAKRGAGSPYYMIGREIEEQGLNCKLLKIGFFKSDLKRLNSIYDGYRDFLKELPFF